MKWKDTTSYSQGERAKGVPPSSWGTTVAWLRISIHRHIHYEKDQWLLSTRPGIFDLHLLDSKEVEDAQKEAIKVIRKKLDVATKAFK